MAVGLEEMLISVWPQVLVGKPRAPVPSYLPQTVQASKEILPRVRASTYHGGLLGAQKAHDCVAPSNLAMSTCTILQNNASGRLAWRSYSIASHA